MDTRNRNRLVLIAIVLLFAAPLAAALLLNVAGWRPASTRNSGTLVQPPLDVGSVPVTLADGAKLVWRDPQWHWTLLALPNGECAQACQTRLAELVRLRITLNRNAERPHRHEEEHERHAFGDVSHLIPHFDQIHGLPS